MKSKSSIQILVVEDEPILGMLIADMLIEIGYKSVVAVASIGGALQFFADAQPDFVFLNLNLKGTLCYPVAALLRSRKIPFVFVSGYDAATLDAADKVRVQQRQSSPTLRRLPLAFPAR